MYWWQPCGSSLIKGSKKSFSGELGKTESVKYAIISFKNVTGNIKKKQNFNKLKILSLLNLIVCPF